MSVAEYKIDLHTHSEASPDGGILASEYKIILDNKLLDYAAVTDHDRIDFALNLRDQLGEQIIVGQEITTSEGEISGLFLNERIEPGMSALQTVTAIRAQGGLVYIPHPFETLRKGISAHTLDKIKDLVDIVEGHNGRAVFQNKGPQAVVWARLNNKPLASSSDAHGVKGLGGSYSIVSEVPSAANLSELLATAKRFTKRPPLRTLAYPKYNRFRRKLRRK